MGFLSCSKRQLRWGRRERHPPTAEITAKCSRYAIATLAVTGALLRNVDRGVPEGDGGGNGFHTSVLRNSTPATSRLHQYLLDGIYAYLERYHLNLLVAPF